MATATKLEEWYEVDIEMLAEAFGTQCIIGMITYGIIREGPYPNVELPNDVISRVMLNDDHAWEMMVDADIIGMPIDGSE